VSNALPLTWRLRAALAIGLIPPAIRLTSFAWLAARLSHARGAADAAFDDKALAAWVDRLMYSLPPPWRRTCLTRGAVMFGLLRRAGRPVGLRIGVRPGAAGDVSAHAWLVRDGSPYLEPDPTHAAAFREIAAF
jgi:hypothetical protein